MPPGVVRTPLVRCRHNQCRQTEVEPSHFRSGGRSNIAVATYEAGMKERTVLSVFPSVDDAIAAHESEDYAAALTALGDGAVREIRIVEGTE